MTEILRSDPQDECGLKLQNLLLAQNDIQLQDDIQEQVLVNAYLANVELNDKATTHSVLFNIDSFQKLIPTFLVYKRSETPRIELII